MTNLEYMICEAEANGEISIDTRDNMLSLITEKKTRLEYRKQKFKKEHEYKPDYSLDKYGNVGSIRGDDGGRVPFIFDGGGKHKNYKSIVDGVYRYVLPHSNTANDKYNEAIISKGTPVTLKQVPGRLMDMSKLKKEKQKLDKLIELQKKGEVSKKEVDAQRKKVSAYKKKIYGTNKDYKGIHMNDKCFNQKHPNAHNIMFNHEYGHVKQANEEMTYPVYQNKKYDKAKKFINANHPEKLNRHDSEPKELLADVNAVKHTKDGANAFKKSFRQSSKEHHKSYNDDTKRNTRFYDDGKRFWNELINDNKKERDDLIKERNTSLSDENDDKVKKSINNVREKIRNHHIDRRLCQLEKDDKAYQYNKSNEIRSKKEDLKTYKSFKRRNMETNEQRIKNAKTYAKHKDTK